MRKGGDHYRSKKGTNVGVFLESGGASIVSLKWPRQTKIPSLDMVTHVPFSSVKEQQKRFGKAVRQHHLKKSICISVLQSDLYQLIHVDSSDLSVEEHRNAARWQISGQIEYAPEHAIIDLFDITPFDSDKAPMSYAVAAQESVLREHVEILRQADLALVAIDIPEFSLRNLCDLFTEDSRGLAMLLLLENSSIFVIVRAGVLYMKRDLSTGMNNLIPYAEGHYEELTDQLDAIVLEVQRSLDYCESTFHLPGVSRLLVAQTQQEIPAVISYLDEFLSTRVEPFSFAGVLDVPEGVEQVELNRHLLAIGGALKAGEGLMRQQINLYQDILIDKPQPLQSLQSVLVIMIVSLLVGLFYGYCYWQGTGIAGQLEELEQQQQAASEHIAALDKQYPKLEENALLKGDIHRLELKIQGQRQALNFFSQQDNKSNNTILKSLEGLARIPIQNLWLRRIRLQHGGEQIQLTGSALKAEQIPAYLQLIGENKIFAGQVFAQLKIKRMQEQNDYINFALESTWESN